MIHFSVHLVGADFLWHFVLALRDTIHTHSHTNTEFLAFVRLVMTLAYPACFIGKP